MAILNNKLFRDIFSQFIIVVLLVLFLWYIITNLLYNIDHRGITTGFDFFGHVAGFGISETPIAYNDTKSTYFDAFLVGLLNTLIVSGVGILFASIIGLLVGIARLSKNYIVSKLALAYIEFFRNIPLLLQILFWYNVVLATLPSPRESLVFTTTTFLNNRGLYIPKPLLQDSFNVVIVAIVLAIIIAVFLVKWANKKFEETGKETILWPWMIMILIGFPLVVFNIVDTPVIIDNPALQGFNFGGGMRFSPEFLALAFALSIYTASLIAEAIRSGIEAVTKGQKEAAASLGLNGYQALKLVVLPQAIRISIPPVLGQYLNLIKNSSLATAIGYPEIVTVFSGTVLNQTGQAIEIIAVTMAVYLTISLFVSLLLNIVNKKLEIKER
ncbi:MAG: ABC transporter permease subunit [Arcobacteraceae bacterium]|nr:ABC transporter permease subunit [Arcobacteraceae bacterium]